MRRPIKQRVTGGKKVTLFDAGVAEDFWRTIVPCACPWGLPEKVLAVFMPQR